MSAKRVTFAASGRNVNSLHMITRPILVICRILGFFPVINLLDRSHTKLRFVFKSPYTIICAATVVGHATLCLLSLIHLIMTGTSARVNFKFLVNAGGAAFTFMTIKLSKNWPRLVHNASLIEATLPKFNQKSISTACHIATAIVFLGASVDFFLSVRFYSKVADACSSGKSLTESYYNYTMPWAALFIPYLPWSFAIMQVSYWQIIFISSFADIFIMIISLYLTYYFKELNALVVLYKDKYPSIWHVLRGHYTKLTRLVKLLDSNINSFVLFSFGGNLAIICVHLFKILRKDLAHDVKNCNPEKIMAALTGPERAAYFTFALTFMTSRSLATALVASRLYTTSQESIHVLYEVPSNCYCTEAHRFLEEISTNTVALSGFDFFHVTQGMILGMLSTIVTYELVMLQFSEG